MYPLMYFRHNSYMHFGIMEKRPTKVTRRQMPEEWWKRKKADIRDIKRENKQGIDKKEGLEIDNFMKKSRQGNQALYSFLTPLLYKTTMCKSVFWSWEDAEVVLKSKWVLWHDDQKWEKRRYSKWIRCHHKTSKRRMCLKLRGLTEALKLQRSVSL